jgi:hypothetical protein
LSQLWQILNSEIAVTVPPERRASSINHWTAIVTWLNAYPKRLD